MVELKREIQINAPVEKVFEFATTPQNLPRIWPSMINVDNVKPSNIAGGHDYDWEYKMAGMAFHGHTDTLEFVPNKLVIAENKEGIPSKFVWEYRPQNGGTLLNLNIKYTVPMPLLGKLAERVILKINENEANVLLANLKAAVEP